MSRVEMVLLNGDVRGYPGCTNLTFQYIEGESLLMALNDICLSSGSACTSASLEPSYVLRALGLDDANAHSSLRFGIGRFTTEAEIDFVCDKIVHVVHKLRELSPLWEMCVSTNTGYKMALILRPLSGRAKHIGLYTIFLHWTTISWRSRDQVLRTPGHHGDRKDSVTCDSYTSKAYRDAAQEPGDTP